MKILKILLLVVIFFSINPLFLVAADNSESLIFQGREFKITKARYSGNKDYNAAVINNFGFEWEVADWNEIEQLFGQSEENAKILADFLTEKKAAGAAVTVNGEKIWSSSRSYGINPHYHSLPSGWLAHDNIQNYMVSLGSWPSERKIIAVRNYSDNVEKDCKPLPLAEEIVISDGTFGSPAYFSANDNKVYVNLEGFCRPVDILLAVQTQSGNFYSIKSDGNPTNSFEPYRVNYTGALKTAINMNHSEFSLENSTFFWLIGDSYNDDFLDILSNGQYVLGVYSFSNSGDDPNVQTYDIDLSDTTYIKSQTPNILNKLLKKALEVLSLGLLEITFDETFSPIIKFGLDTSQYTQSEMLLMESRIYILEDLKYLVARFKKGPLSLLFASSLGGDYSGLTDITGSAAIVELENNAYLEEVEHESFLEIKIDDWFQWVTPSTSQECLSDLKKLGITN